MTTSKITLISKRMMLSRTLFLSVVVIQLVQSEVLFELAYFKFTRHEKRQPFYNVSHIDQKIVPNDKHLIIVKARPMEVLYPKAIRNLKNLQDVYLSKCGIERVEPGAFLNLPSLNVLHLEDNQINEIKKGVFNFLTVRLLSLQRNQIKTVDPEAFDDMPNLYRIKLNKNLLKSWDSEWFKNTPKLTELYFRRNKINYLPPFAFANIKSGHFVNGEFKLDTKIFLSKNKLGEINPESFYNLERISQLYLDRNGILEIPGGAFRDLTEIDVIYLARNKIGAVDARAFPKVRKIGILDLSANLLKCLPYELVTVANITYLEKNNGSCSCVEDFKAKLKRENRNKEISYDEDVCN